MDLLDSVLQKVIDKREKIDSDPRIKSLDHQISVCQGWLAEEKMAEMSENMARLISELSALDEVMELIESPGSTISKSDLWRLNGEPGKYNDVSGSMLEVCSRWVNMGVLTEFPRFEHGLVNDGELPLGNQVRIEPDGTVVVSIVTKKVEEIPAEKKNKASDMNYQYSDSELSVAELRFPSQDVIRIRQDKAEDEYQAMRNSQLFALSENMHKELQDLKEKRTALANEISLKSNGG
jgi:hypothetical protein